MDTRRDKMRRDSQQGMALLIVLWSIAVLTLISAVFTTTTRTETNRTRNLVENAKAEGLANAGIHRAIAALLEADPSRHPLVDGTAYRWRFGDAEIVVSIQSEAGKIDLNTASDPLLEGLFLSIGVGPEKARSLVDAIRDFADRDDLRRPFGAEDADYLAAGLADGAKDGQFDRVAELQQVLGMTPKLYENVAQTLTVYSRARSIDPATAPQGALLALPRATHAQVEALIAARGTGPPGSHQQSPDGTDTQGDAMATLGEITTSEEAGAGRLVRRRTHTVFTIVATAKTPSGGTFERVAVVRLTSDLARPFVFHEWRQSWAPAVAQEDGTDKTSAD